MRVTHQPNYLSPKGVKVIDTSKTSVHTIRVTTGETTFEVTEVADGVLKIRHLGDGIVIKPSMGNVITIEAGEY